jgi:hypothetical protein
MNIFKSILNIRLSTKNFVKNTEYSNPNKEEYQEGNYISDTNHNQFC